MSLLKLIEINDIIKQIGTFEVKEYSITNYSDKLIGYLGEHLKLTVVVEESYELSKFEFFIKCIPSDDEWKANYIQSTFFKKEFVMLNDLFQQFEPGEGAHKWRPKAFLVKENLFVFEDVTKLGYRMAHRLITMTYEEMIASVTAMAKFHAQSYILEEKKSRELKRSYRICEEFLEFLNEPENGQKWRDTGRNAVIDFLKEYSTYKSKSNFDQEVEEILRTLYEKASLMMRPSTKYRNVVIHRDLWSNNIFLKENNGQFHALFVDFQTVLYCPPMLDLSSMIYLNTSKNFRMRYTNKIIDIYYEILSKEVNCKIDVDFDAILKKSDLLEGYEWSKVFGLTQAALIVPIIALSDEKRDEFYSDPESSRRMTEVTRSQEFIDVAKQDKVYHDRVTELFDEVVEIFFT